MTDAEIDVQMPTPPAPNVQPEDPLKVNKPVDNDPVDEDIPDDEEDTGMTMKIKEIVPDNEVFKDASGQAPPKRKKKEISEKQKAHLAKIRVKALEAKKAKAQGNDKPKSAKKVYEQKIEEEYSASEDEEPVVQVPANSSLITLSQDQLRKLQFEAIYGYDTIRKARKEEKKKVKAQEEHERKTYQAVSRAINRPVDDDGWGICFQ